MTNKQAKEVKISPISDFLSNIMDMDVDNILPNIFVVTNRTGNAGASAILDKASIKKLAKMADFNEYYVIPSSRHEMLIVPVDLGMSFDDISLMVKEVNASTVAPIDRLTDRAYKMAV